MTWLARRHARAAILAAVWLLAAWYVGSLVDRGWGPPDEGLLGQSAERFLNGELPHRDFDELYTGGLTVVHSAAMSLMGTDLLSLRMVLFGAVVLWIPLIYLVARRFVSPLPSAAMTLLVVAWSVPAYPASMPSWYNLFLATASLWAILRFAETSRLRWSFAAGICGGLSIAVKITGLYLIAALLLTIAVRAYSATSEDAQRAAKPRSDIGSDIGSGDWRIGPWVGFLLAGSMVVALLMLLAARASLGTWLLLFASPATACMIVGVVAWRSRAAAWRDLWQPTLALALGVLVGVAPLVVYFASHGAIADLFNGVFVLPRSRIEFANRAPNATAIVWAMLLACVVALGVRVRSRALGTALALLVVTAGAWLLLYGHRVEGPGGIGGGSPVYAGVVGSLAGILPFVVAYFAWLLMSGRMSQIPRARVTKTFAVVAVAAFSALVAFPYANDLYFHYTVPLLGLAGVAVLTASARPMEPRAVTALMAVYMVFALLHVAVKPTALLAVDRGGLRVPAADSADVEAFVNLMRTHARSGFTFATPDAPEAYFLTGLRNPTRTMYEFFDEAPGRTERILEALDTHQVTVIAINHWIIFSGRPEPELVAALQSRYPHAARAWRFTVRWRDPD